MKIFKIALFAVMFAHESSAQTNAWFIYNDSIIKKICSGYKEYCSNLNSNKEVSKRKIRQDKKLINLANKLYNDVLTVTDLSKLERTQRRFSDEDIFVDTLMPIYFYPFQKGNLRLIFKASNHNDTLTRIKIIIETDTRAGCREKNDCCVSYFDFIYIRDFLLPDIMFPMLFGPATTGVLVEKENK